MSNISFPLLKLDPVSLLQKIAEDCPSGYLEVVSNSVLWQIHLVSGELTYASYLIKNCPSHRFKRIRHHLNRLGLYKLSALIFDENFQKTFKSNTEERQFFQGSEYQVIFWLFQHRYLNLLQTKNLITLLNKEAFELFLLIPQGAHEFHRYDCPIQEVYGEELTEEGLSRFDLKQVIDYYQKRSQIWQTMIPAIESPYQRPYLTNSDLFFQSDHQNIALGDVKRKLVSVLNGHSIHDLAASLKWDELKFAKFLHPYVVDGAILLREPEPPYDQLPQTSLLVSSPTLLATLPATLPATLSPVNLPEVDASVGRPTVALETQQQRSRTVVCIDDSSNMLDTIEQYLKKEKLSVFKISEPAKAVLQLRQIKPDMILLDVGMPLINGYELCRMLRNSPRFKTIPIVMVTGRDGFLNKAKAQVVGATDYLTKPFTESDLLEVVFKHLT